MDLNQAGDLSLYVDGADESNHYLHLIKAIDGKRFLIGNNRGGTNGWVGPSAVYGRATTVERS